MPGLRLRSLSVSSPPAIAPIQPSSAPAFGLRPTIADPLSPLAACPPPKAREVDAGVASWESPFPQRAGNSLSGGFALPVRAPLPAFVGIPSLFGRFVSGFEQFRMVSPGAAAIVVENLPANIDDAVLLRCLFRAFRPMGEVYVKLSRSVKFENGAPVFCVGAILQFASVSVAEAALSVGLVVGGRAVSLRLENAPRAVFAFPMERDRGVQPSLVVVRAGLRKFGRLERGLYVSFAAGACRPVCGVRVVFVSVGGYLAAKSALGDCDGESRFVWGV